MTSKNSARSNQTDAEAALRIVTDGAHEIRNQLSVALLELGKISHPDARRIEVDMQVASETVNRVAILFKLTMAETLVRQSFDLTTIIRNLVKRVELVRPNRLHRIEINQVATGVVFGHAAFITEAIRGLLENAVGHTPAESRVILNFSGDGTLTIDDNGPGLPPEVEGRFGEPFVRGRTPSAGAGLGVAIAHRVVRLHGGRCYLARSELGGTRVCLDLGLTFTPSKSL